MKRTSVLLTSFVLLLALLTACSTGAGKYSTPNISESVVNGNSEFAINIVKALNTEDADKNIFISPFSISTALTMALNGAENDTKTAMENVLGYKSIDRLLINESYKGLLEHMQNMDKKIELNIGNSIWIREGEKINEAFITDNKKFFDAEVAELDFSASKAADTINQWISKATKGKIEKMLDAPIDPDAVMFLINAIYFKGEWSDKFDPKLTHEADFFKPDGSRSSVQMMSRQDTVFYGNGEDYKVVRLPYGKGKTSMTVILPGEGIDINEFVEKLNSEKWDNIQKSISEVDDVQLGIPKFKLEYGIKNLNDSLKSLGMEVAFSDNADFTGIRKDICISRVLHKAIIEVNEQGSEASAATVVEMREVAARMEPISFIADRPFMFLITDDTTGTIMFMGKVMSI